MKQKKLPERMRLTPRVDREVARLAKSKCAMQEITLEFAIERLLSAWLAGKVNIVESNSEDTGRA